jgi:outer membrane protein
MKLNLRNRLLASTISTVTTCLLGGLLLNPAWAQEGPLPIGNSLEDFYKAALESSPFLNIAQERWNISSARKDAINGQLLPQISATANISDNDRKSFGVTRTYDGERFAVQLNQVLFNWSAFAARKKAYLQEDASEAEYYARLAGLLTEVADKYLSVLQAEDALGSIDSQLEAMTNQVNQIESLYARQLVRITDLYDAQARLAAIQAERVNLESALIISREGLRALTNLEAGELSRLPEEITITPLEGELSDWIDRTRQNNQMIESRNFAYQAAQQQVSEQRGAYLPKVSLVLQQADSNTGFDNQLVDDYETTYIGLDVQVPLFAGGTRRASVREAVSLRSIAQSELRQTQLDMIESARTAYLQVKTGESRINAARVLAESTATSYEAMQRGFELGTVTSVDLLNALRDRFQAERELQRARYDHIRADLVLRREAGELTAEDLLRISNLLESSN